MVIVGDMLRIESARAIRLMSQTASQSLGQRLNDVRRLVTGIRDSAQDIIAFNGPIRLSSHRKLDRSYH